METMGKTEKNTHHGHAIKRVRHTLGIKQDTLAIDLGISQALVSFYEQKKVIDDDSLEKLAMALNVSTKLLKDLEEDPLTVIIENNTFEEGSIANVAGDNTNNYNPIEQILELNKEKQVLYERMLELEKEKVTLLEQLLKDKK